jgi:four helix bundle protein
MGNYKELLVWKKSHRLALKCHKAAKGIRGAEYLSLRSQMIKAAFSVPSNIVEGNGVQTAAEYARFIRTSLNSNDELEYHIITARDLPVMSQARAEHLLKRIEEVGKMLNGLLKYLNKRAEEEKKRRKGKPPDN